MIALITGVVSVYLVSVCKAHSVVAEYKNLDKNVLKVLFHPLSVEDWDKMLKTVEYYTIKVMNFGMRISTQLETDKVMVNKIVNNGKPKFLNCTLNVQELTEELGIPFEKIQEFYDMCAELRKTWIEFVKIAKAMKWQKKTRKPYIVQGAFHGRRLGRKKGRSNPYPMQDNKKQNSETEIDDLEDLIKEYESKSSEYNY